ncbi:MAG TPA: malonic semialdehyde reductase [Methylophilaceae bacterium]
MGSSLDDKALDQLFRNARTYNGFSDEPVSDDTLGQLYDLVKWGPTAFNSQPSRYIFIRSAEAKERLAPALSSSNREKTLKAPVNVILAYDTQFFEHLPKLTASPNARELFVDHPSLIEPTALRNGSLQAGYLILAARALGLDVGVITGFDADLVNQTFLAGTSYRANVIANIGYGDVDSLRPRARRFTFEEVAQIL